VTLFLGVFEVSVYAVYYLIIRNISIIITGFIGPGVTAAFGNMIAKKEEKNVRDTLRFYEFIVNALSTLLYTCTALLIVQFVSVYTQGVDDVNYYRPIFAYLVCIAQFSYMLRAPYESVVYAAGHFKQTRNGAIAEAIIQVVISLALIYFLGLIGVAIGALCSAIFRTVQYAIYVSRNIVERSVWTVIRKFLISILSASLIILVARYLPEMAEVGYIAWILHALPIFGVAVGVTVLVAVVFYREEVIMLINGLSKVMNRKTQ
jgi:O-antigen/teichoic acid export membrane protein